MSKLLMSILVLYLHCLSNGRGKGIPTRPGTRPEEASAYCTYTACLMAGARAELVAGRRV